jgi:hypothetical protein
MSLEIVNGSRNLGFADPTILDAENLITIIWLVTTPNNVSMTTVICSDGGFIVGCLSALRLSFLNTQIIIYRGRWLRR